MTESAEKERGTSSRADAVRETMEAIAEDRPIGLMAAWNEWHEAKDGSALAQDLGMTGRRTAHTIAFSSSATKARVSAK